MSVQLADRAEQRSVSSDGANDRVICRVWNDQNGHEVRLVQQGTRLIGELEDSVTHVTKHIRWENDFIKKNSGLSLQGRVAEACLYVKAISYEDDEEPVIAVKLFMIPSAVPGSSGPRFIKFLEGRDLHGMPSSEISKYVAEKLQSIWSCNITTEKEVIHTFLRDRLARSSVSVFLQNTKFQKAVKLAVALGKGLLLGDDTVQEIYKSHMINDEIRDFVFDAEEGSAQGAKRELSKAKSRNWNVRLFITYERDAADVEFQESTTAQSVAVTGQKIQGGVVWTVRHLPAILETILKILQYVDKIRENSTVHV